MATRFAMQDVELAVIHSSGPRDPVEPTVTVLEGNTAAGLERRPAMDLVDPRRPRDRSHACGVAEDIDRRPRKPYAHEHVPVHPGGVAHRQCKGEIYER